MADGKETSMPPDSGRETMKPTDSIHEASGDEHTLAEGESLSLEMDSLHDDVPPEATTSTTETSNSAPGNVSSGQNSAATGCSNTTDPSQVGAAMAASLKDNVPNKSNEPLDPIDSKSMTDGTATGPVQNTAGADGSNPTNGLSANNQPDDAEPARLLTENPPDELQITSGELTLDGMRKMILHLLKEVHSLKQQNRAMQSNVSNQEDSINQQGQQLSDIDMQLNEVKETQEATSTEMQAVKNDVSDQESTLSQHGQRFSSIGVQLNEVKETQEATSTEMQERLGKVEGGLQDTKELLHTTNITVNGLVQDSNQQSIPGGLQQARDDDRGPLPLDEGAQGPVVDAAAPPGPDNVRDGGADGINRHVP